MRGNMPTAAAAAARHQLPQSSLDSLVRSAQQGGLFRPQEVVRTTSEARGAHPADSRWERLWPGVGGWAHLNDGVA